MLSSVSGYLCGFAQLWFNYDFLWFGLRRGLGLRVRNCSPAVNVAGGAGVLESRVCVAVCEFLRSGMFETAEW